MNLSKKIKIELWALLLIGLLSLILAISNGILVRQELIGSKKFGIFSKTALFLAEIPVNVKKISLHLSYDLSAPVVIEKRFRNISEFHGKPVEEERYLLLSRYDGDKQSSIVELIDLRTFDVKKTWNPDIEQINSLANVSDPEFENLLTDRSSSRFRLIHPFLTEDGGLIFKHDTPLIKIDKNSQLVWLNQKDAFHHSTEQDHEGNFWVPSRIYPYKIDSKFVGKDYGTYHDDAITKVSPDGTILYQKSVSEILIENDLQFLIFGRNRFFVKDPVHLNDIQPVLNNGPFWNRGDLFLSLRHLSMVLLYRPSTNKIIWKSQGHNAMQHDVNIINNHTISIFNNNSYTFHDGSHVEGNNEVLIYDFLKDKYSKYLENSSKKYDVRTITEGRSLVLKNGDLFIEESDYGRLLYFNKDASLQWQFVNRAKNGNIYFVNWSRILNKPEDITKVQNILNYGD